MQQQLEQNWGHSSAREIGNRVFIMTRSIASCLCLELDELSGSGLTQS